MYLFTPVSNLIFQLEFGNIFDSIDVLYLMLKGLRIEVLLHFIYLFIFCITAF